jgi:hypothetical protein
MTLLPLSCPKYSPPFPGAQSHQACVAHASAPPEQHSPDSVLPAAPPLQAQGAAGSEAAVPPGAVVAALSNGDCVVDRAMHESSDAYAREDYARVVQLCQPVSKVSAWAIADTGVPCEALHLSCSPRGCQDTASLLLLVAVHPPLRLLFCPLQLYLAGHSRRTDLLLLLGAAHYQLGNYEQCVACNDQCILLDPSLAEVRGRSLPLVACRCPHSSFNPAHPGLLCLWCAGLCKSRQRSPAAGLH